MLQTIPIHGRAQCHYLNTLCVNFTVHYHKFLSQADFYIVTVESMFHSLLSMFCICYILLIYGCRGSSLVKYFFYNLLKHCSLAGCVRARACVCVLVAQLCLTLATPWALALQAPLSVGFSRQEYQSGLPVPSPYWLESLPFFY